MKKILVTVFICIFAILALSLAGVYYSGVRRYQKVFFPNVYINGIDCSGLTPERVTELLEGRLAGFRLEVRGRDPKEPERNTVIGIITPDDVSLRKMNTRDFVTSVFVKQEPRFWFFSHIRSENHFEEVTYYDKEQLEAFVKSWDAFDESATYEPTDAYLSEYLPEENAYRVIPDTVGSRIDVSKALPAIAEAMDHLENQVDIETTGCYNVAKVRADDKTLNDLAADLNLLLGATIRYDWYGVKFTIGAEQLREWVSIQDGKAVLDEEAVTAFVKDAKKKYDPNGNYHVFHTSLDADVTLKCKTGWQSDEEQEAPELIALIKAGAVTDRRPVSKTKDYVFFDGTVGGSYAEIDLTNQHMYFYYQGELVLDSDFVSGDVQSGHATPEGIYVVTYKQTNRVLRGPDYESFVYYWMPFYGGYGMHDATWRSRFGGSIYLTNGSHGCINLPKKVATEIYSYVEAGYPVVVYHYPKGENPKDRKVEITEGGAADGTQTADGSQGEQSDGTQAADATQGEQGDGTQAGDASAEGQQAGESTQGGEQGDQTEGIGSEEEEIRGRY